MEDTDESIIKKLKNSCCSNPKLSSKGIMHNGNALRLDPKTNQFFKYLVLYSTNSSLQYKENDLFTNKDLSENVFKMMTESMKLSDEEVILREKEFNVSIEELCNNPCTECQKLILIRKKDTTLPMTFLIHLRNSIAHGRFNIIDNIFIGMDWKPGNYNKFLNSTAYIKIKLENLNTCFDRLFPYEVKSYFREPNITNTLTAIMIKMGYKLKSLSLTKDEIRADYIISKNNIWFYFEIKKYPDYWIRKIDIEEMINRFEIEHENCIPVLLLYASRFTNETKKFFFQKRILALDKIDFKMILLGYDRLYEAYLNMYTEIKKK